MFKLKQHSTRDESSEARVSLEGAEVSERQALCRDNEEATI